jgi:DNA-directed RNA polymerase alpha subunit
MNWDRDRDLTPTDDALPALSIRAANCLRDAGLLCVGDVRRASAKQLLAIPHFGARSLAEVRRALAAFRRRGAPWERKRSHGD